MEVTCLTLVSIKYEKGYNKRSGSREGSGTFMSNTNCHKIKMRVEQGRLVTTLNIIKHEIPYLL